MTIAWAAHLYTASGAVLAFLAATRVIDGDYRAAFFWLAMQVAVDATDGVLARALRVAERVPWFNGAKLDDIVDYLAYVFVPALIVWRVPLVTETWIVPVAGAMLLSSAYGFNRADAKTDDHFFSGFPSYWNILVLYLLLAGWSRWANAAWLLGCAALVFAPIRFVYPSRTPAWRAVTNTLAALWGAAMLAMLWQYPAVSRTLFWLSLLFPAYYTVLSLHLQSRRA
jgi:phosphatidylcholine synthase